MAKKLFLIGAMALWAMGVMAQLKSPVADVKGDLSAYNYYYVVPTNAVTSSSGLSVAVGYGVYGNQTNTVSPSETISGYLMKNGYNVTTSIIPEKADQTLIVSYGYTGRRELNTFDYASCIIIQMRNAATQELVASFEAEGYGYNDEAEGIMKAIFKALDWFSYYVHPTIAYEVASEQKKNIYLFLYNYTPSHVSQVVLFVSYYKDGELVHEQEVKLETNFYPSEQQRIYFKRPEDFRSKDLKIRYNVISYK
jgi:hypothetical protein